MADLYQRTLVEKDSLRNLIRGGYLDALTDREANRARLLQEAEGLSRKRRNEGQPEMPLPHPASWWSARENGGIERLPLTGTQRERVEWEVLGLNVSRHPLLPYRKVLKDLGVTPSEKIKGLPHGTLVRAAGLIECLQQPPTKSGRPVWFLLIEDEGGLLQATVFQSAYERYGDLLHHKGAFLLEGRVEQSAERGFSFLVELVGDLHEALEGAIPPPRATSVSGAFLRAGRRGRKAG